MVQISNGTDKNLYNERVNHEIANSRVTNFLIVNELSMKYQLTDNNFCLTNKADKKPYQRHFRLNETIELIYSFIVDLSFFLSFFLIPNESWK